MVYSGKYGFEDFHWRHSKLCIFAGVLATVSSEASALFVSLITFDRILAITRPFSNPHLVARRAILLSALAWIVSLVLALCPLFIPLEDFYAQTAICIYLPLSVKRQSGWEYSMVVFIGFNFILFLGILVGQIFILVEVIKSGRKIQSTNTKRREISLAKSVGAVVLTDLLCWIPIGIIAMMTFSGVDVSQEVYIWIIVLVLPINSALNPILYTLSALIRERNRQNQTPQRAEM
ncbi:G-protein coupled receptor GRL101-like [Saccostrea cucullata]